MYLSGCLVQAAPGWCWGRIPETRKANDMKKKPNTRYFTRRLLIEASRLGLRWDYNRQLSERIAEVPDRKYPVDLAFVHRHRHGQPHVRCVISLGPVQDDWVICDVPTEFFEKLPRVRKARAFANAKA